jgi:hypothetical protein
MMRVVRRSWQRFWRSVALVAWVSLLASCGSSTTSTTSASSLSPAQRQFVAWVHAFIAVKPEESAAIAASSRFNKAKSRASLAEAYRQADLARRAWQRLELRVTRRFPNTTLEPARTLNATYQEALALLIAGYHGDERGIRDGGDIGAAEAKNGEAQIARAGMLLQGLGPALVTAYMTSGGASAYGSQLLQQLDARAK